MMTHVRGAWFGLGSIDEARRPDWAGLECSAKCDEPIAFFIAWTYSTSNGRIAYQEQGTCVAHAKAFAERHGIQWAL